MPEPANLHLLWITENYPPSAGGMSVSCDRIVRGLRNSGAVIDVLHLSRNLTSVREDVQWQGRYFGWPLGDDPSHALNLLFERISMDSQRSWFTHVVAFGGNLPILAGPTFAAWLGLPLITLLRGNDFDIAIFSAQRAGILREALEKSAGICTVSREKERRIKAMFPSAPTVWTPNGIDLEDWTLLPSDRTSALKWRDAEVPQGKRVLGMFGQIKPKKGGLFLLESLVNSGLASKIHLLLVGELAADVQERLASATAPFTYTALPFGDRYALLRHYGACDAIAVPSYYDGTPNVVLEAMGLGIPLLASTAGGMGDFLEDGVHGFLFPPGDAHGCRSALARFSAASDEILAKIGSAGRELVREFTSARETASYLEILSSSIRSNPTSGVKK